MDIELDDEYDYPVEIKEADSFRARILELEFSFNTPMYMVLDELSLYFEENNLDEAFIESWSASEIDTGFLVKVIYSI